MKVGKVSWEPLMIAWLDDSAKLCRNVPALDAVHSDTCEIVSEETPVKALSEATVIDPPDGAFHVIALRVVTAATFDVPAAPGSPTCSCTKTFAMAEAAVLR